MIDAFLIKSKATYHIGIQEMTDVHVYNLQDVLLMRVIAFLISFLRV